MSSDVDLNKQLPTYKQNLKEAGFVKVVSEVGFEPMPPFGDHYQCRLDTYLCIFLLFELNQDYS